MQGSIKLYRSFLDWEWWNDHNTSRVFLYLLLNANWKDSKYRGYDVPKGSLVVGRKALAKSVGLSEQQIRTSLEHLKSTNEITTKVTNKFTIITVVNWEKYQCSEEQSTNKTTNNSTNEQPTSNQQVTTSEERNNIKEIEKDKSFSTKKVAKKFLTDKPSIPLIDQTEYFIDEDFYNECVKAYPGVDIDKELLGMRVWCIANPKQKKTRRGVTKFINGWLSRAEPTKPVQQKSGVSEALKNFMNRSYMTICGHWQKNHGIDLTKEDALYFRDKMLALGDENRVKFMVEKFRRNADQDEISDFKEFTDAWLLENGNL